MAPTKPTQPSTKIKALLPFFSWLNASALFYSNFSACSPLPLKPHVSRLQLETTNATMLLALSLFSIKICTSKVMLMTTWS
jgi:hypothetical protein